jgi:Arc/MetJ-type ribon-helix-helix transcriptional regulator
MAQVAKVTISLPKDLLAYVDRKQEERGISRSEVVRRAIERLRREERERELDEQYVRGWREQPQTEEELGWVDEVGLEVLADLPWEDDDAARRDLVGQPAVTVGPATGTPNRAG